MTHLQLEPTSLTPFTTYARVKHALSKELQPGYCRDTVVIGVRADSGWHHHLGENCERSSASEVGALETHSCMQSYQWKSKNKSNTGG